MAKKVIQAQMQQRRDTAANWAASNPVLLEGELGIVTDDPNLYKIGDGVTAWNDLKLRGFDGTLVQTTGDSENAAMSQKAVTEKLTELESIYLTNGAEYGDHKVTFNNTTLWIFRPSQNKWDSVKNITETFNFYTSATTYLVLDNNMSVKFRASGQVLSTDVVLLVCDSALGFVGGELYPEYIMSRTEKTANESIYMTSGAEYGDHKVTFNNATLWILHKGIEGWEAWQSIKNITTTFTFPTTKTTFLVIDNNQVVFKEDTGDIYHTENVILLVHDPALGFVGGELYPEYINRKVVKLDSKTDLSLVPYAEGSFTNATGIFNIVAGTHVFVPVNSGDVITLATKEGLPMVYAFMKENYAVNGELGKYAEGWKNVVSDINAKVILTTPHDAKYLMLLRTASNGVNYLPETYINSADENYVLMREQNLSAKQKAQIRANLGISDEASHKQGLDIVKGGYVNLSYTNEGYVSTTPIWGDVFIRVKDEYRIASVVLLDNNLTPISVIHDEKLSYCFPAMSDRTCWGMQGIPSDNPIVISFCKADKSAIEAEEPIVSYFYKIDNPNIVPSKREDHSMIKAHKRGMQVQYMTYIPSAPMPVITDYYSSTYRDVTERCIGLPYSSVKELDKFVPYNVSFHTFMTALANKRSLLYTENVSGEYSRSAYGVTYNGVGCASYYGIACNWFTALFEGLRIPGNSFEIVAMPGMSLVYDSASEQEVDISMLRPMDILYRPGHISVISDIFKSPYDETILIAWSEANVPFGRISLYDEAMFKKRLHEGDFDHAELNGYKIYRYSFPNNGAWDDEYTKSPYTMGAYGEEASSVIESMNICTFAGDDAIFLEGEKIVLNVIKEDYNICRIYKDGVAFKDISLGTDNEIDIDLSAYNLIEGDYEAWLTDGSNKSKSTTWHIYSIELSLSDKILSFVCPQLEPIYIEFQQLSGVFKARVLLSDIDKTNGYVQLSRDYNSSEYVKIFAKTKEGLVVTKRIQYVI